ncbi:MAG: Do family serine endopeptidase [Armatimonadetes bacterium]|nr:Do family serine endopeptidase [Armatimonadota bacterium]
MTVSTVNRHSHITIILLSVLVGAVLTGLVLYYPRAHSPVGAQEVTQVPDSVQDLEDAFVAVADATLPAVVSINVETSGPTGNVDEFEEFFKDNPFFEPFFRDREEGREGGKTPKRPRRQPRGMSMGSGWIYSEDGYIVTNSHVVRDAVKITVKLHDKDNEDKEYPAELVGNDPKTELAVIKVDAGRKLPTVKLGKSADLKVGQWVMAVGAPFSLEQTATVGIVSAKGRFLPGQDPRYMRIGDIIQTDAAINPGNSGGPLVNMRGEVIGINVAIVSNGFAAPGNVGIGFAIPADTAARVIPALIKDKKVARGWLGISISELDENAQDFFGVPDGGVLVEDVNPGGPAAKSDLKIRDVIVAVNGQRVRSTWELQKTISDTPPGEKVVLDVIREKRPAQVEVVLGEMPAKYTGLETSGETPAEVTPEVSALGIVVEPLTNEAIEALQCPAKSGVVVADVDPEGPALGRLEKGDIITAINNTKVDNPEEYRKALEEAKGSGKKYVMVFIERRVDDEWTRRSVSVEPEW